MESNPSPAVTATQNDTKSVKAKIFTKQFIAQKIEEVIALPVSAKLTDGAVEDYLEDNIRDLWLEFWHNPDHVISHKVNNVDTFDISDFNCEIVIMEVCDA